MRPIGMTMPIAFAVSIVNPNVFVALGLGRSRRDRVDADVLRRKFERQRPGDGVDRAFEDE